MSINKLSTFYQEHYSKKIRLSDLITLINTNLDMGRKPLTAKVLMEIMIREGRDIRAIQERNPEHLKYINIKELVKKCDVEGIMVDSDFALTITSEFSSHARNFVLNDLKFLRSGEQLLNLPLTQDLDTSEGSLIGNELAQHFQHSVFLKSFYTVEKLPSNFNLDYSSVAYKKKLATINHTCSYKIFELMFNPLLTKVNTRLDNTDLMALGFAPETLDNTITILGSGYYPTERLEELITRGYIKVINSVINKDGYFFRFEEFLLHVSLYTEIRAAFSHNSDCYDSQNIL